MAACDLDCISNALVVDQSLPPQFDLHSNQITQWRSQLLENVAEVFGGTESDPPPVDVRALQAKLREPTLENTSSRERAQQRGMAERKAMIVCCFCPAMPPVWA